MAQLPRILHTPPKMVLDHYILHGIEWPAINTVEVFSIWEHEGTERKEEGYVYSYNVTHQIINLN